QTYTCLTIFSFPRSKLPTAHALKPSSLPYIFKEHEAVQKLQFLNSFLDVTMRRLKLRHYNIKT
ncbi:hypothetical protein, partial [Treponema socranskii]|uniref:hypothetical protein n=1 Tax=Treponema socranskii TaxID=53419 RepID=UPI003D920A4B